MTKSGSKSRRDRMVIAIAVVVALYALAALLWFTGRDQAWANARKGYEKELKTLQREKALIRDRALWEERAETKRLRMPLVGEEEMPATRWERIIEHLAEQYHVSVGKGLKAQQVEEDHGGVWEMPVDGKYDNTSLLRLVEFLYAVNTVEDAMMDVREIEINAARGKNAGALHGKIVLTCAYLKGNVPDEGETK